VNALLAQESLVNVASICARIGVPYSEAHITYVATGSTGVVYLLTVSDHAEAALKLPAYSSRPKEEHSLLERTLVDESTVLLDYSCEAIPALLRRVEGQPWVLREYLDGLTLQALLASSSPSAVMRKRLCLALFCLGRQLFRAFHESSRQPLILRDIKPTNVIVARDMSVMKFFDVGSARPEGVAVARVPRTDRIGSGRWLYMAPEHLLEMTDAPDRKADYFSLAAMAYAVLTGVPPYTNSESNPAKALTRYLHEYAALHGRVQTMFHDLGLLPTLADFVVRGLHPEAHRRPNMLPFGNSSRPMS
jgi:serine/threonine protein kinase